MNKVAHLTVFLSVISAIAGGALAWANNMTAPVIAANNLKQEKESLQEMYPDASLNDFKQVKLDTDSTTIQKVYTYEDKVIFNMSVSGYKDGTTFLSNGDTKGLGSQVLDKPFRKSLEGKKASGQLDTISGATISSSAVTAGINEAAGYVKDVK